MRPKIDNPFRWSKKSRAFVVDNLFSIECTEIEDLVAVLEEGKCQIIAYLVAFVNSH